VVIFGSPNTLGHSESEIGRDDDRGALVKSADEMERQLPAGLGERKIAEFIEDDDVEASKIVGDALLSSGSTFGLELIDEIDGGEEPRARTSADAAARWRCVLPAPVPLAKTTLRCWTMKPPPAKSRTIASSIGVY
jgi:hypothetical protein